MNRWMFLVAAVVTGLLAVTLLIVSVPPPFTAGEAFLSGWMFSAFFHARSGVEGESPL